MDIQKVKNIRGRRHPSEAMKSLPKGDPVFISSLRDIYPKALVSISASKNDTARFEHDDWCHDGDGDVSEYFFVEYKEVYYLVVWVEF